MLTSQRVRLRLVERQDLSLLVTWRNMPSIWAGFFNKLPLSFAGQEEWFARLMGDRNKQLLMICLLDDDQPIGAIGLDKIDFSNQSAELGNLLIGKQQCLGKGYAGEATRLLLSYCFLHLNMNRVYLEVYADNAKALRLYENCGFQVDGRLREARFRDGAYQDTLVMSILRREFTHDGSCDQSQSNL